MCAVLDDLVIALYVTVDELLGRRPGPGRPPRLSDAELVCFISHGSTDVWLWQDVIASRSFAPLARNHYGLRSWRSCEASSNHLGT